MGIDWALLQRVNNGGMAAQRAYVCEFVEAIKQGPSLAPGGGSPFLRAALAILAAPYDADGAVGDEVRARIKRKEALDLDDPRMLHTGICRRNGIQRIWTTASGEFEAR